MQVCWEWHLCNVSLPNMYITFLIACGAKLLRLMISVHQDVH